MSSRGHEREADAEPANGCGSRVAERRDGVSATGTLNRVLLLGNAGADPELRTTAGGRRVAQLSLATSRTRSEADSRGREVTEWHRIVAWDELAEQLGRSVRKGDRLYVEGRLEYRSWQDGSGGTRSVTEIIAEEVVPLGGHTGRSGSDSAIPLEERSAP